MPSTFTASPRIIPRLLRTSAIALTLCLSHYGWSATLPAGLTWESNNADPAFADPAAKRGGTFRGFMTSFPLTLRVYGPDSNGGFAGYMRETNLPLLSTHPVTGNPMPMLANEWAFGPDHKTLYLRISEKHLSICHVESGKQFGDEPVLALRQQGEKKSIIAVGLDEGDYLVGVAITDGQHDVMMFSDAGKAVRFTENDVRPMGRQARGVRGMMLEDGQTVIAMLVASNEEQSVLTATENGFGKRTPIGEYTRHGRGTKGMIAIQTSDRNGKVVAATLVTEKDQIMLITTGGVLVRTRVSEIREMGRATQGVTLISVDEGSTLSGVQKILEGDEEDHEDGEVSGEAGTEA